MCKEKESRMLFIAMFTLALLAWFYVMFCFAVSLFGAGSLITR